MCFVASCIERFHYTVCWWILQKHMYMILVCFNFLNNPTMMLSDIRQDLLAVAGKISRQTWFTKPGHEDEMHLKHSLTMAPVFVIMSCFSFTFWHIVCVPVLLS